MVENQTKKIIVIILVFTFFTLVFSNGKPTERRLNIDGRWEYKLNYGYVEKEVKKQYMGDFPVPWADGFSGKQFVSQLLTVRDGFHLSEEIFATGNVRSRKVRLTTDKTINY